MSTNTSAATTTPVPLSKLVSLLTVEQLKLALPEKMKKTINQELLDKINTTLSNPEE